MKNVTGHGWNVGSFSMKDAAPKVRYVVGEEKTLVDPLRPNVSTECQNATTAQIQQQGIHPVSDY